MANEERKKEDLFIKEKRRAKNFFITSSAKMSNDKNTKTILDYNISEQKIKDLENRIINSL